MPTTLSPVDVANVALSKIGAQTINSLLDQTNASASACNNNWQLVYLEVSRASRWNCLMTSAALTPVAQTPIGSGSTAPPSFTAWAPNTFYAQGLYLSYQGLYYQVINAYTSSGSFATDLASGNIQLWNSNGTNPVNAVPWAQFTFYQANAFVTFGNYYYQVLFNYTSSANFTNDLTAGFLIQTDEQTWSPNYINQPGNQYPSGWPFAYALPADFQLLATLNENVYWDWNGGGGANYQLMGANLFCNESYAVIQYVKNQPDTTQFDSLFTNALTLKLASAISTALRQDGGKMEEMMLELYRVALREARTKNGGEQQDLRWNPIAKSRFNAARYGGRNG